MTKAEIVTKVAYNVGLEKHDIAKVLDNIIITVKQTVISGEEVTLRGFGTFFSKPRAKKIGRNISKGETVPIAAHCIAAFNPSKEFTELVKKNVPYFKRHIKKINKIT